MQTRELCRVKVTDGIGRVPFSSSGRHAVTKSTDLLEPPAADYTAIPENVEKLLGNVLANVTMHEAALRKASVIGRMNNVEATEMIRKWFATRGF